MVRKGVTEREVIQWFLERVSARESGDPDAQRLDKLLVIRSAPEKFRSFGAMLAPGLATATGALEIRAALTPTSWGRMAITYELEGWNRDRAAKGSEAFALSLLLDETRPHAAHLGRCQVCGKFFLADEQVGTGRKATEYCPDGECRAVGTRQKVLERVKAHRARSKSKVNPIRRKP
jgi:hypothetical protein